MTRYWISDKDSSKTGFLLGALLRLIINFIDCKVQKAFVHRAEGYGEKISLWDDLLFYPDDKVSVSYKEITELLDCEEETLYWLDVEFELSNGKKMSFGLHDSSSMYVECSDDIRDLLDNKFEDVKVRL
ncbi:hypothetical protein [Pseudoalteromonas sp. PPB1]|uniref:hypothetical protein n=1 Tax=Pseudoalteromonas sp. PPB1 TaxID=2756136 RepID=UPI001890DCB9|nr:hypothetical protein [Pseudoalteromonas sp. PPB1]